MPDRRWTSAPILTTVANSFTPAEGSLLQRLLAARGRLRPGQFRCGLRVDDRRPWRYARSSIDGDVLVYRRRRLRLQVSGGPRDDNTAADGFVVWSAVDRTSGRRCEIAVADRDAYRISDSALSAGAPPTPPG
jgi:hypothetical protein